ncbi:MAG: DUF6152 family protein [Micropepsaceae bacterium]
MRSKYSVPLICSLFALPISASAHHSQAMYDASKQTSTTGIVSEWEWTNPHTWLHLMVKDESGQERLWTFESNSTGQLMRGGWSEQAIKAGDEVTVTFRPLRDGTRGGSIRAVRFPDGRELLHPGIGGYDAATGALNVAP